MKRVATGKIVRAAACLVMVGLLFVLLATEKNITNRIELERQEPVSPSAEPINLRMRSQETMAVLFCDLAARIDGEIPTMLMLAVIGADGVFYGVNLPAQTRVLVDELNERGECVSSTYAPLADAYALGAAGGLGFENLIKSVSRLFGGLPIDGCIAIGEKGVEKLVDSIGGIQVRNDYFSALSSGVVGGNQSVLLDGEQTLAYMASTNREVDTGALTRQQEVFLTIFATLREADEPFAVDKLLEQTRPWFWSNLSDEYAARFGEAMFRDVPAGLDILWGENRIIDGISYRLPDKEAIKRFVLTGFYPAPEETGSSVTAD